MNQDTYNPNTVLCPEYRTAILRRHRPCAHWNQRCPHWTYVKVKNPETGQDLSRWGCALAWKPVTDINLLMKIDGLHAAINDMRNHAIPLQGEANNIARAQLAAVREQAEAAKTLVERVEERRALMPPAAADTRPALPAAE